jgi:hypothetical protein
MPGGDGCPKCVIDTSMSVIAARLYAGVLARLKVDRVRPIDIEAPIFYAEGVERFVGPLSAELWAKNLKPKQRERLTEQLQQECYRAAELQSWAKSEMLNDHGTSPLDVAAWTAAIFEWADQNQEWYTAFAKEVSKP